MIKKKKREACCPYNTERQEKVIPDPGRMLITPFGNPALAAISANFKAVMGVTYGCEMMTLVFMQVQQKSGGNYISNKCLTAELVR